MRGSVEGAFKVETYEKGGATKISLPIVADRVLALRQPYKKSDAGKARDNQQGAPEFDDAIPFR
jgi:hypothetical protein